MLHITIEGYTRITKAAARRAYEGGQVVRITACKLSPVNIWGAYSDAQRERFTEVAGNGFNTTVARSREFDTVVNAFTYYNCNNECGRYPAFYVVQD